MASQRRLDGGASAGPRNIHSHRLRVLVVDGNTDAADSTALLMHCWGHEVRVARDGQDAIAQAPVFQPDVILVDVVLPKIDGYQVARHFRARHDLKYFTLIAVTGLGDAKHRYRSQEAGFDLHLVKPVAPERLHSILTMVASSLAEITS